VGPGLVRTRGYSVLYSVQLGCIQIMCNTQCYKDGVGRVTVFFLCVMLTALVSVMIRFNGRLSGMLRCE
jgi:hypothetical protein